MMAAASQGFHMFQAHTENLCLRQIDWIMPFPLKVISLSVTYDTATGSDEMISRTFSQPNVVMYAMQYISCHDGVGDICTNTVYVENIRNSI